MKLQKIPWRDFVKLKGDPDRSWWVIDCKGVKWDKKIGTIYYGNSDEIESAKFGFCAPVFTHEIASVEVVELPITLDLPHVDEWETFYQKFYDLVEISSEGIPDYNREKVVDFMLKWRFDCIGGQWFDIDNKTVVIFTIDELMDHLFDFVDNFNYFGLKEDLLDPEIYLKNINTELSNLIRKKGSGSSWGESHQGRLDVINHHLSRIDLTLKMNKHNGKIRYCSTKNHRDLLALAYFQLFNYITSDSAFALRRCSSCDEIFEPTSRRHKYCSLKCQRKTQDKKYYQQIKRDPKKMNERRAKGAISSKKYRDSLKEN